jgi:hypothetical protein
MTRAPKLVPPLRAMAAMAAMALVALGAPTPSHASDHIDGLKTAVDNAADLTDLFTFTSPDHEKLVLIMNVHGFAFGHSRFSNAVDYKFRIRPIDDAKTLKPSTDPRREQSFVCSFSGGLPFVAAKQHATCTFNVGTTVIQSISFDTRGDEYRGGGSADEGGIRVFAGVRSDPWFLDLAKTLKFNNSLPVSQTIPGINGLHGQNVLSIVVEIDKRRFATSLLAITAQTVRK